MQLSVFPAINLTALQIEFSCHGKHSELKTEKAQSIVKTNVN